MPNNFLWQRNSNEFIIKKILNIIFLEYKIIYFDEASVTYLILSIINKFKIYQRNINWNKKEIKIYLIFFP